MEQTVEFWNDFHTSVEVQVIPKDDQVASAALIHFGDMKGKTLAEIGFGTGGYSLLFASLGAKVVAIDTSSVAVGKLHRFCESKQLDNIVVLRASAFDLPKLGKFDFVFGKWILHHLEPFDEFAQILDQSLSASGKAFFYENNAAISRLAMWIRGNILGRLWFPRYSDADESPLAPDEVNDLRKYFHLKIEYPDLLYFRLISWYLFRDKLFARLFRWLDKELFRLPAIRRHSYHQYLFLTKEQVRR